MRILFSVIFFLLLSVSCNFRQTSPMQQLDEVREKMNRESAVDDAKRERYSRLDDSLYLASETHYLGTIKAIDSIIITIDSIIKYDDISDKIALSDFNTLKGDIHYKHDNYHEAVKEYSKLGGLYRLLPPLRLRNRAAAYVKLNQYDSAYKDLRNASYNTSIYWYLGNYFEILKQKDSALSYYTLLQEKDTTHNKICTDRINELQKKTPKYFKEFYFIH